MQIQEIIKAAIPRASDALCEHIIWGRTAYPFAQITARVLYRAASRYKRAHDHGFRLCDFCDRQVERGHFVCPSCNKALRGSV